MLFCLTGLKQQHTPRDTQGGSACGACVYHCMCVLDAEGSWVGLLVCRALVVAYTAVDQTSYTYSDCLTSFHGLLLPPSTQF